MSLAKPKKNGKKSKQSVFAEPKYATKVSANRKLSQMGANVSRGRIEITNEFLLNYEAQKNNTATNADVKRAITTGAYWYSEKAEKRLRQLEALAERQKSMPRRELYEGMAKTFSKKVDRLNRLYEEEFYKTGEKRKRHNAREYIAAIGSVSSYDKAITAALKTPTKFASAQINARIVAIMGNATARKIKMSEQELNEMENILAALGYDLRGVMEQSYADYSRVYEYIQRTGEKISASGFDSDQFVQNIVDANDRIQEMLSDGNLNEHQMQLVNRFFEMYSSLGI